MSTTVSELNTELQYWIGEDVDSISLINTAIRFISKRLYVLNSELIIGMMEVPIYAEFSYQVEGVSFVSGSPCTITVGAPGDFVTAGFVAGMYVTTDSTTNPGPFTLDTVATLTLTLDDDDSVTDEGPSEIEITNDDSFGFLPSDFWGLVGKPYLDGKTYPLLPLPNTDTELQYTSAGTPHYYKIRGDKIYVTPHTSADFTIKSDYFQKPTLIENTTDELPWNDLFNDVIYEVVINLFKKSGILVPELQQMLNASIDVVANKRGRKAPSEMGKGIYYDDYL
jgi:hypothetical protein